jgi:hypothetical protein
VTLLFWIRHYYPGGGMDDLVGVYLNWDEANAAIQAGGLETRSSFYPEGSNGYTPVGSTGDGHWQAYNTVTGHTWNPFPRED